MTTPVATSSNVTQLLVDWRNGNNDALNQLMLLVYDELRDLANATCGGKIRQPGCTVNSVKRV